MRTAIAGAALAVVLVIGGAVLTTPRPQASARPQHRPTQSPQMTPMPPPPIEIDQFKQPCGRSGVDDHKITGDILVWYCRNGDAYSMNLTPQNVKR